MHLGDGSSQEFVGVLALLALIDDVRAIEPLDGDNPDVPPSRR